MHGKCALRAKTHLLQSTAPGGKTRLMRKAHMLHEYSCLGGSALLCPLTLAAQELIVVVARQPCSSRMASMGFQLLRRETRGRAGRRSGGREDARGDARTGGGTLGGTRGRAGGRSGGLCRRRLLENKHGRGLFSACVDGVWSARVPGDAVWLWLPPGWHVQCLHVSQSPTQHNRDGF